MNKVSRMLVCINMSSRHSVEYTRSIQALFYGELKNGMDTLFSERQARFPYGLKRKKVELDVGRLSPEHFERDFTRQVLEQLEQWLLQQETDWPEDLDSARLHAESHPSDGRQVDDSVLPSLSEKHTDGVAAQQAFIHYLHSGFWPWPQLWLSAHGAPGQGRSGKYKPQRWLFEQGRYDIAGWRQRLLRELKSAKARKRLWWILSPSARRRVIAFLWPRYSGNHTPSPSLRLLDNMFEQHQYNNDADLKYRRHSSVVPDDSKSLSSDGTDPTLMKGNNVASSSNPGVGHPGDASQSFLDQQKIARASMAAGSVAPSGSRPYGIDTDRYFTLNSPPGKTLKETGAAAGGNPEMGQPGNAPQSFSNRQNIVPASMEGGSAAPSGSRPYGIDSDRHVRLNSPPGKTFKETSAAAGGNPDLGQQGDAPQSFSKQRNAASVSATEDNVAYSGEEGGGIDTDHPPATEKPVGAYDPHSGRHSGPGDTLPDWLASPPGAGQNIVHVFEEPFVVAAAGVVLCWAMLPGLFNRLWPEGMDTDARHQAVLLLDQLIWQDSEPAVEWRMSGIRVLCGLSPDAEMPQDIQVEDAHLQQSREWLDAVMAQLPLSPHLNTLTQWDSNMLCALFLQRSGVMRWQDDGWKIQVASEAQDLLLSELPWPLDGFVLRSPLLPWLDNPIMLEWSLPELSNFL